MIEPKIILPSKPKIVKEDKFYGVYEIDRLYPGYGHTLGNSLRRIILSSLPGSAITSIRIQGVEHEFSTIEGVKEDVISIILNLKKVRFKMLTDAPQTLFIKASGPKEIKASDIECPGQVEVINKDAYIATLTNKGSLDIEIKLEKGLGYVPKEMIQKDRVSVGEIVLDASFTPIRKVNYEVENMRVGDRTDFNKLRIVVETDGTIEAREALERSIYIMIEQLKAIVGFEELPNNSKALEEKQVSESVANPVGQESVIDPDVLKTRIEELGLSVRTVNALSAANIRTLGGLAKKKESEILEISGLGVKGMQEIKKALSSFGIELKR
jgi:DNA-directed RNA polymerase subunit alpha